MAAILERPGSPGIEQFGILDGSEKMSTTTGTKIVNNYVEKGKDDVYYWFGSDLYGLSLIHISAAMPSRARARLLPAMASMETAVTFRRSP